MKQNQFELTINVEVRQTDYGHQGLSVRETVRLNANSFMELAAVLAQFHELAKKLSESHGK